MCAFMSVVRALDDKSTIYAYAVCASLRQSAAVMASGRVGRSGSKGTELLLGTREVSTGEGAWGVGKMRGRGFTVSALVGVSIARGARTRVRV